MSNFLRFTPFNPKAEKSHRTIKKCVEMKSSNKSRKAKKYSEVYITPFSIFSPFKIHGNGNEFENYVYVTPENKKKKEMKNSGKIGDGKKENGSEVKKIQYFDGVGKKIKK